MLLGFASKVRIGEFNPLAEVHLLGQEVNPETFTMCKSDHWTKNQEGRDAENIKFDSTLSNDRLADKCFDNRFTNPQSGKEWKKAEDAVEREAERGNSGRIGAGSPRIILPFAAG